MSDEGLGIDPRALRQLVQLSAPALVVLDEQHVLPDVKVYYIAEALMDPLPNT